MKKPLKLPKFEHEDDEQDFWSQLDLSDHYMPTDARRVRFPNLKPTTRSISIRLPEYLIDRIKEQANALNVPYQSLIKRSLAEVFFGKSAHR